MGVSLSATKKRFGSRLSWPKMMSDISKYIRSCYKCQAYANRLPLLPIEQSEITSRPFDKVAIDTAGPLNLTRTTKKQE
ncbi:reverse ribonuclease integrase [Plakobranchus ocellatus]|uniref:Reverse ribonuclease integrase n=1 Tax=Plakobranchus ocellatus TaxID=259542 RepID=A0AAV4AE06_9GAST|nr:reverse ribonuclease integrase [Plakobranchus ocellatus]